MLTDVTTEASCDATRAYLLDASGTVLATEDITANVASFSYPLDASTSYKVVVDND